MSVVGFLNRSSKYFHFFVVVGFLNRSSDILNSFSNEGVPLVLAVGCE